MSQIPEPYRIWENKPSANDIKLQNEQKEKAANYLIEKPWDAEENELLNAFDKMAEAQDYQASRPWDMTDSVIEEQNQQKEQSSSYQYKPLWEPLELTEKQKQMISNYKIANLCPFRRDDNYIPNRAVNQRKTVNTKYDPRKSLKPWEHGKLPPEVSSKPKIYQKPATSLWDVPKDEKKVHKFESSGDPILDSLKEQLHSHGATGILSISKKFKIISDGISNTLDFEKFKKAMKEYDLIDLSDQAIKHLFHYFDTDDSGAISLDEFLFGIRGTLNQRRNDLVRLAFNILDIDKSGSIDFDDIKDVYDASNHPDVIAGRLTTQDVLNEFLSHFERNSVTKQQAGDYSISYEEFERYYANISSNIDNDDYFELMMRNAWHISGGEGWAANSTNKRILVTHSDGSQTVEEVKDDMIQKRKNKLQTNTTDKNVNNSINVSVNQQTSQGNQRNNINSQVLQSSSVSLPFNNNLGNNSNSGFVNRIRKQSFQSRVPQPPQIQNSKSQLKTVNSGMINDSDTVDDLFDDMTLHDATNNELFNVLNGSYSNNSDISSKKRFQQIPIPRNRQNSTSSINTNTSNNSKPRQQPTLLSDHLLKLSA